MAKTITFPLAATMSREILYEDGSGPRCKVSFDSTYRLGDEDHSYVCIQGVGGDIHVCISDLDMIRSALEEAETLDRLCRLAAPAKQPEEQ